MVRSTILSLYFKLEFENSENFSDIFPEENQWREFIAAIERQIKDQCGDIIKEPIRVEIKFESGSLKTTIKIFAPIAIFIQFVIQYPGFIEGAKLLKSHGTYIVENIAEVSSNLFNSRGLQNRIERIESRRNAPDIIMKIQKLRNSRQNLPYSIDQVNRIIPNDAFKLFSQEDWREFREYVNSLPEDLKNIINQVIKAGNTKRKAHPKSEKTELQLTEKIQKVAMSYPETWRRKHSFTIKNNQLSLLPENFQTRD